MSSLLSCTQVFRLTKKTVFHIWCSLSGVVEDSYSVHNLLSLGKQFLTSSIPLWLLHPEDIHNTVHPSARNHTPSNRVSNDRILDSSAVPLCEPKTLQNRVRLQNYTKDNIHTTWARTTSLSGTYLCCLHHVVRVVVFHRRQFSHMSTALIDAQRKLSSLFTRPCNTCCNAITRPQV
jgi:hypothetical protein